MKIAIASGKGGTGKTTFAVNLAYHLNANGNLVRLLDGDVEEPNDHLFVPTDNIREEEVTVLKPKLDPEKCIACGKCAEACEYNALALVNKKLLFFNELCHACGACSYVCPNAALKEEPSPLGKVLFSETAEDRSFYFAYGILNIGESLAPALVKQLKQHMLVEPAGKNENKPVYNILDASPGTACPVVEALSGTDTIAVLVTEPTPFGLNDLKLAAELSLNMGNATGIVINRSNGDDAIITDFAKEFDIPILGRISFDRKYAETYSCGGILIKHHPELTKIFDDIFMNIKKLAEHKPSRKMIPSIITKTLVEADFKNGNSQDYKEIVVISGKGGTGKTTITSSLAYLCEDNVIFDADVDAADLHLLLKPAMVKTEEFSGSNEFVIDSAKCFGCGQCASLCHFDAIDLTGPANNLIETTYEVNPLACEGCGLCQRVCPVNAFSAKSAHTGDSYLSVTNNMAMLHAKLGVGGENSGKLVSHVRGEAANFAKGLQQPYITGDGPPGTSCPVIASVTGADLILMVTEPTVSGVHDLLRVIKLVKHFGIQFLVIINKADLNAEMTRKIHEEANKNGSKVIAEIPFDRNIHDSLMAGKTIVEYGKGESAKIISKLWEKIK